MFYQTLCGLHQQPDLSGRKDKTIFLLGPNDLWLSSNFKHTGIKT